VVGGSYGTADGVGTSAELAYPYGLVIDSAGKVFFSERSTDVIRMFDNVTYNVVTIAGTVSSAGYVDGVGTNAKFSTPGFLASDNYGTLYVADFNSNKIRYLNYV
jgi:streptogramin lyase